MHSFLDHKRSHTRDDHVRRHLRPGAVTGRAANRTATVTCASWLTTDEKTLGFAPSLTSSFMHPVHALNRLFLDRLVQPVFSF